MKNKELYNPEVIAVSKLAKVEIAATNYTKGKQKYFTYDEALQIEKDLKDTGWRLPTRQEWVLICEEFACKDGMLNSKLLQDMLNLELLGLLDEGENYGAGYYGAYWSSTEYSSTLYAYALYFYASSVYPSTNHNRYYRFPVRLVRSLEK